MDLTTIAHSLGILVRSPKHRVGADHQKRLTTGPREGESYKQGPIPPGIGVENTRSSDPRAWGKSLQRDKSKLVIIPRGGIDVRTRNPVETRPHIRVCISDELEIGNGCCSCIMGWRVLYVRNGLPRLAKVVIGAELDVNEKVPSRPMSTGFRNEVT